MEFARSIDRRLHEEHVQVIALCERLERAGRAGRIEPALAREAAAALAGEVGRHFDFEEQELFPRLEEAGEGDLVALLLEEHASVREAAARFAAQLQAGSDVRVAALEVAERLASHAQKEEVSLLPSLENLLDEDADRALSALYCG